MKTTLISLCALFSVAFLVGCNDSYPDYPLGDGGWQVYLEVGRIPNPGGEYPVFVDIDAEVVNLADGGRASDGSVLLFGTSCGSFENGLAEIEKGTLGGVARSTLQIDKPGRYEVSVEYLEESSSSTMTIIIGTEM